MIKNSCSIPSSSANTSKSTAGLMGSFVKLLGKWRNGFSNPRGGCKWVDRYDRDGLRLGQECQDGLYFLHIIFVVILFYRDEINVCFFLLVVVVLVIHSEYSYHELTFPFHPSQPDQNGMLLDVSHWMLHYPGSLWEDRNVCVVALSIGLLLGRIF